METKTIENTAMAMYTVNKTDDLDFIKSYATAVYDVLATCYNDSKTEIPDSAVAMMSIVDRYKIIISNNQIYAVGLYKGATCYRIARNMCIDTKDAKLAVNAIIKSDHPEYEGLYHVEANINPVYWEKEYDAVVIPPVYAIAILDNYIDTAITDDINFYKIKICLPDDTGFVPRIMFAISDVQRLIDAYSVWDNTLEKCINYPDVQIDSFYQKDCPRFNVLYNVIDYIDDCYTSDCGYNIIVPSTKNIIHKILTESIGLIDSGVLPVKETQILSDYIESVQCHLDYSTILIPQKI